MSESDPALHDALTALSAALRRAHPLVTQLRQRAAHNAEIALKLEALIERAMRALHPRRRGRTTGGGR